jgi:hypothetical protein
MAWECPRGLAATPTRAHGRVACIHGWRQEGDGKPRAKLTERIREGNVAGVEKGVGGRHGYRTWRPRLPPTLDSSHDPRQTGSVTKRFLCIPVQSTYECKTRGEEKGRCPPRGEADAHTRKPCHATMSSRAPSKPYLIATFLLRFQSLVVMSAGNTIRAILSQR